MVNFEEIYHFSRFQKGSNIFQGGGGSNFFKGGGSNCLFPIETHIICDYPGGSGPPVPPLDPHLKLYIKSNLFYIDSMNLYIIYNGYEDPDQTCTELLNLVYI